MFSDAKTQSCESQMAWRTWPWVVVPRADKLPAGVLSSLNYKSPRSLQGLPATVWVSFSPRGYRTLMGLIQAFQPLVPGALSFNPFTEVVVVYSLSCVRLYDPRDCGLPGSSVHGTSQARILEWVTISFSKGSSLPGDPTCVSCIGRHNLYHWASGKVLYRGSWPLKCWKNTAQQPLPPQWLSSLMDQRERPPR